MSKSKAYIAGVGLSPLSSGTDPSALVSATCKALLDAGITYDNVAKGVRSKDLKAGQHVFAGFGDDAVSVDQAASGAELKTAYETVQSRKASCVLAVVAEKSNAVGFVLVSEDFMMRWPYLKDSSILVESDTASKSQSVNAASSLCQKVWELRGWKNSSSAAEASVAGFKLSRADAQKAPEWKDVEHKQDGKHRLGYNPAQETREISQEDFEAVRTSGKGPQKEGKSLFKREGGDREILKKQLRFVAKL